MIAAKFIEGKDDLKDGFLVRTKVFVEEQGIEESIVFDSQDQEAVHVVAYEDDIPVATGRLIKKENKFLLGRLAVLKSKRGKYYGDLAVKMLLDKAFNMGAEYVYIHSQLSAVKFYERIGFKSCSEVYMEAGIEHISMKISQEEIIKDCQK